MLTWMSFDPHANSFQVTEISHDPKVGPKSGVDYAYVIWFLTFDGLFFKRKYVYSTSLNEMHTTILASGFQCTNPSKVKGFHLIDID